ncbi:hypothetical protein F7Q99_20200 [Streptomyces kaniharaensis]|uniref:Uncharacterized protein n=1 Tax=Streptomyces kaniharaensis TaxID=212423 RepID=A0A6N7KY62_9ACTN|nr:hypothetical protein [Streptomyces kaniharaensis]MQS14523.1 hypothetical protein [Streptomyces kaniharaensis]
MAGYANRIVTLDFPELTEPGDEMIRVVMRNPKTVPGPELMADTPDNVTSEQAFQAGLAILAKLIVGWHVYDATSTADDQPPLPMPATADSVGRLPMEIQNRMAAELKAVTGAGA